MNDMKKGKYLFKSHTAALVNHKIIYAWSTMINGECATSQTDQWISSLTRICMHDEGGAGTGGGKGWIIMIYIRCSWFEFVVRYTGNVLTDDKWQLIEHNVHLLWRCQIKKSWNDATHTAMRTARNRSNELLQFTFIFASTKTNEFPEQW